LSEFQNC